MIYFSKYSRIDPQHSSPSSHSIVKLSNVVSSLKILHWLLIFVIMMMAMLNLIMNDADLLVSQFYGKSGFGIFIVLLTTSLQNVKK